MLKNIFLSLIALSTLSANAWDRDSRIDTKAFMEKIKGRYNILTVNGIKPHTNNLAQVEIEDPEAAEWAMPYCVKDSCIPGFISFDYAKTEVYEEVLSPTSVRYLLTQKENGVVKSFVWRETDGRIFFQNPQYELPGHAFANLEHELTRQAD